MSNWQNTLENLENGTIRAASLNADGSWTVNKEVKEAILEVFRNGKNIELNAPTEGLYPGFVDKDNLIPRRFQPEDGVRMVPGGSSVRRGAYVGRNVVLMPPAYVNIGAYVDEGSMIDSHALVGSCAQIGKNVHLSAAVQIGGVLEPIGSAPVVVEDDAFIGAGAIIVEGVRVGKRAVIAPGVVLSKGVPIYDSINEKIIYSEVPANAVIVPGTRPTKSKWCQAEGVQVQTPVIIKYRDERSEVSLLLEGALRN